MSESGHNLPASGHLLPNLLLFGRLCKGLGMDVNPERMMDAARALEYVSLGSREDVYYALRAVLVTRQRDLALFDEAFREFWGALAGGFLPLDMRPMNGPPPTRQRQAVFLPSPDNDSSDKPGTDSDPESLVFVPTYSTQAALRNKDFAQMTGEELEATKLIMAQLPRSLGLRRTRRYRPGKGKLIDARRALRQNMRYAGEPIAQPTRKRRYKPRPLVLICDISGSMERYTRVLLHFAHTLANNMYQVESFVFSTSLTHITHPIRHKSVELALREVGLRVRDWGGGTKTGDALRDFNYHWSRRVLGRGAVVMLITDGWDRGDPDVLKLEMARLQRSCYRLIWLNPLLGAADYEPLTRGSQAMLPYVDDFLPVRNLANLDMIVRELRRVNWRRKGRKAASVGATHVSPAPSKP
ncbi:MAG: VWA domain-containing protein [Burkholderiales bacterium]|nr:VWA domain-containing protein [Anaerolineae bacterium]